MISKNALEVPSTFVISSHCCQGIKKNNLPASDSNEYSDQMVTMKASNGKDDDFVDLVINQLAYECLMCFICRKMHLHNESHQFHWEKCAGRWFFSSIQLADGCGAYFWKACANVERAST